MPLTTEQQAVIDNMQGNFDALMTALVEALEVDNDRTSTLEVATPKREALKLAFDAFQANNLAGWIRTSGDGPYLMREAARSFDVDGVNVGDPTWTVPRF